MSQVVPEKPLRVVVWSTGTIGRHAIAGIDAHPDLELVGVWVSNPDKHGLDAGVLAELGRELGITATTDRDELTEQTVIPVTLALEPTAALSVTYADSFAQVVRLVGLPPGTNTSNRSDERQTVGADDLDIPRGEN